MGQLRDLAGQRFPLAPAWHLVGTVQYRWSVGDHWQPFVGANATYQSDTTTDLGDAPILRVHPYALVDLRAGISDRGRWSAELFVSNVANQGYTNYVTANAPDVITRFAGQPRSFGLRLRFHYSEDRS